jgi:uncharacterized protein (DUF2384 family)
VRACGGGARQVTASEVMRVFHLHKELLLVYEPNEALTWLTTRQHILGERRPCECLATVEGYDAVLAIVRQLTDSAHG